MTDEIVKVLRSLCYSRDLWSAWCDFLEMATLSLSNVLEMRPAVRSEREGRYVNIANKYSAEEVTVMGRLLGMVTCALDVEHPDDVLGRIFMELELGNKWAGQFFTPISVCDAIAAVLVDDEMRNIITKRGFITVNEPAVGGGATIIGLHNAFRNSGLNPQTQMHVTAVDIDPKAAHMAYVQFSLLNIPAVVIVGDTLRLEEREVFYTAAHVIGGWSARLRVNELVGIADTLMTEHDLELSHREVVEGASMGQLDLFR